MVRQCRLWLMAQWIYNRAFHFAPNSIFSRFSEVIPCHWLWIIKRCHFSPIKLLFYPAQEIKFRKYYRSQKINPAFILGSNTYVCLDERIPNMCSEFVWIVCNPYFGRKPPKNIEVAVLVYFKGFGKNMDQTLSKFNSESIFGILSSRGTF